MEQIKNSITLCGEYQTVEQYARDNNISRRGVGKRLELKSFKNEVVKFKKLILIKIK